MLSQLPLFVLPHSGFLRGNKSNKQNLKLKKAGYKQDRTHFDTI